MVLLASTSFSAHELSGKWKCDSFPETTKRYKAEDFKDDFKLFTTTSGSGIGEDEQHSSFHKPIWREKELAVFLDYINKSFSDHLNLPFQLGSFIYLYVCCYMSSGYPNWFTINNLQNLQKLVLRKCKNCNKLTVGELYLYEMGMTTEISISGEIMFEIIKVLG